MRKSSANQLAFDWATETNPDTGSSAGALSEAPSQERRRSGTVDFTRFDSYDQTYAVTARLAGRINAASVSPQEHENLLRKRQELLDKKFAGKLTREDGNKLEYIRWSLDRIEDAKHGNALDYLEGRISVYEQFLADVRGLEADLRDASKRGRQ